MLEFLYSFAMLLGMAAALVVVVNEVRPMIMRAKKTSESTNKMILAMEVLSPDTTKIHQGCSALCGFLKLSNVSQCRIDV